MCVIDALLPETLTASLTPLDRFQGHYSTRSFSHQLRRYSGATSLHDAPTASSNPEDGPTLHAPPLSHDVALVQAVVVSRQHLCSSQPTGWLTASSSFHQAKTADPGILTQVHYISDAVCTGKLGVRLSASSKS